LCPQQAQANRTCFNQALFELVRKRFKGGVNPVRFQGSYSVALALCDIGPVLLLKEGRIHHRPANCVREVLVVCRVLDKIREVLTKESVA